MAQCLWILVESRPHNMSRSTISTSCLMFLFLANGGLVDITLVQGKNKIKINICVVNLLVFTIYSCSYVTLLLKLLIIKDIMASIMKLVAEVCQRCLGVLVNSVLQLGIMVTIFSKIECFFLLIFFYSFLNLLKPNG